MKLLYNLFLIQCIKEVLDDDVFYSYNWVKNYKK